MTNFYFLGTLKSVLGSSIIHYLVTFSVSMKGQYFVVASAQLFQI